MSDADDLVIQLDYARAQLENLAEALVSESVRHYDMSIASVIDRIDIARECVEMLHFPGDVKLRSGNLEVVEPDEDTLRIISEIAAKVGVGPPLRVERAVRWYLRELGWPDS